jgi:HEAT repeat protein
VSRLNAGKKDMTETGMEHADTDPMKVTKLLTASVLSDEDPLVRKHAVYLIGIARNPDCIPILIQSLKDPEKGVRSQATQALAMMGEPAVKDLLAILNDPDWKVRYRTAEALGMIGDDKAASPLIELLSDKKDHVRYMAAKSLSILGNPDAREALQRCQMDENAYVRKMASFALLRLGK